MKCACFLSTAIGKKKLLACCESLYVVELDQPDGIFFLVELLQRHRDVFF